MRSGAAVGVRVTKTGILRSVSLTLDLAPDMEIEACEKTCAVAKLVGMSTERVDEIRMAMIEACINAIEHSGAKDAKLHVDIAVLGATKPEELRITVTDHGVGFDREKLVEPKIEKKLKASNKRGWGLQIIEGLMDEVDVASSSEGTSVIMRKKIA